MASLVGQTFGRWTVLQAGLRIGRAAAVLARCDCGVERTVNRSHLQALRTKSCGCLSRERARDQLTIHGQYRTPEWRCWAHMVERCISPTSNGWSKYGARGIRVCAEWQGPEGFTRFLAHIGTRPSLRHSIDRINNDGHYEPGNVRWATAKQQANNRRSSRRVEWRGETRTIAEWSGLLGLSEGAILARLKSGWSADLALSTPLRGQR